MHKTVAYIRASTDKQDLNHQKLELLEFARKKSIADSQVKCNTERVRF